MAATLSRQRPADKPSVSAGVAAASIWELEHLQKSATPRSAQKERGKTLESGGRQISSRLALASLVIMCPIVGAKTADVGFGIRDPTASYGPTVDPYSSHTVLGPTPQQSAAPPENLVAPRQHPWASQSRGNNHYNREGMTYTMKTTEIIEADDLLPSGKLPRLHPKTFHQLSDAKAYADKLASRLAEKEPDSRFVVEVEEKTEEPNIVSK